MRTPSRQPTGQLDPTVQRSLRQVDQTAASGSSLESSLAASGSSPTYGPLFPQPLANPSNPVLFFFRWWESLFAPSHAIRTERDYERIRRGRLNADILLMDMLIVTLALLTGLVSNPATVVSVIAVLLLHVALLWLNRHNHVNFVSFLLPLLAAGAVFSALLGDAITNGLSYYDLVGYTTIGFAVVFAMYLLEPRTAWIVTMLILIGGVAMVLLLPWAPDLVTLSATRSLGYVVTQPNWTSGNDIVHDLGFVQTVLGRTATGLLLVAIICWRESGISRQTFREAQEQNQRAVSERIRREEAVRTQQLLEQDMVTIEAAVRDYRNGKVAHIDVSTMAALPALGRDHPAIRLAYLLNTFLRQASDTENQLHERSIDAQLALTALNQLANHWSQGWLTEVDLRDHPINFTRDAELATLPAALTTQYYPADTALRELERWLQLQGKQRDEETHALFEAIRTVLGGDYQQRVAGNFFMETKRLVTPLNHLLDRCYELAIRAGVTTWHGQGGPPPSGSPIASPSTYDGRSSGPLASQPTRLSPPDVRAGAWQEPTQSSPSEQSSPYALPEWLRPGATDEAPPM